MTQTGEENGGYDDGYRYCNCFWGNEPGSLIKLLPSYRSSVSGMRVWDAGCGEGKNAIHLARLGAQVDAYDLSKVALANARRAWPDSHIVNWIHEDVRIATPPEQYYDLVVMYGLLHCLASREDILTFIDKAQRASKRGGLHVVVCFNNRRQNLDAHPGFSPTFLANDDYIAMYKEWHMLHHTDRDLHEVHPHNGIPHTHAMTRLIAEKT